MDTTEGTVPSVIMKSIEFHKTKLNSLLNKSRDHKLNNWNILSSIIEHNYKSERRSRTNAIEEIHTDEKSSIAMPSLKNSRARIIMSLGSKKKHCLLLSDQNVGSPIKNCSGSIIKRIPIVMPPQTLDISNYKPFIQKSVKIRMLKMRSEPRHTKHNSSVEISFNLKYKAKLQSKLILPEVKCPSKPPLPKFESTRKRNLSKTIVHIKRRANEFNKDSYFDNALLSPWNVE